MASPVPLSTPEGRAFTSALSPETLLNLNRACFRTHYRGAAMYKNALDLMLYLQALEQLKPNTIIEIGSKSGGSALWFADTISAAGRTPRVVSIDLEPPADVRDARIEFISGDACALGAVLTEEKLASLPRPWLVSEDSAHLYRTSLGVLDFFADKMAPGELIVVEDGAVSLIPHSSYAKHEDGPNRAVAAFLAQCRGRFAVDTLLCDFFGYNATFNINGWLRRTDLA